MLISTVKILKYVNNAMFNWFWTTFSLGAPVKLFGFITNIVTLWCYTEVFYVGHSFGLSSVVHVLFLCRHATSLRATCCMTTQRGLRSRDLAMIWTSGSAHSKISSIVWKACQSWKTVFCPNLPVRKEVKIKTIQNSSSSWTPLRQLLMTATSFH